MNRLTVHVAPHASTEDAELLYQYWAQPERVTRRAPFRGKVDEIAAAHGLSRAALAQHIRPIGYATSDHFICGVTSVRL